MIKKLIQLLQEKNNAVIIKLISKNPELLDLEDKNRNSGFLMIA